MSLQESIGENCAGKVMEKKVEGDFKRIDAMEEDQEVTSRLQSGAMLEELQS